MLNCLIPSYVIFSSNTIDYFLVQVYSAEIFLIPRSSVHGWFPSGHGTGSYEHQTTAAQAGRLQESYLAAYSGQSQTFIQGIKIEGLKHRPAVYSLGLDVYT